MQIDSWQLKIMASADDDIHVSLDGGTAKGAKAPSVDMQDGVLDIVQAENEDTVLSQFSLGKEGEVTVYVPDTLEGTVTVKNGSGDMEIDSLVASKLTLDNSSGYIEMNNVTADVVEIASSSGDVKLSGGKIDDFQISTSSGYVTWKIQSRSIFPLLRNLVKSMYLVWEIGPMQRFPQVLVILAFLTKHRHKTFHLKFHQAPMMCQ